MKLEFKDIINPNLKNDVQKIEYHLDKAFKKKETKIEYYIRNNGTYLIVFFLAIMLSFIFGIVFNSNIMGVFGLVFSVISFAHLFLTVILEDILSGKKMKSNIIKSNIFKFYTNKKKNINEKRINKHIKELTPKQKEILEYIEKNNIYKKSFSKIQEILLTEKFKNGSQSEFDLQKSELFTYLDNIEDQKQKVKFENLINENFKNNIEIVKKREVQLLNKIVEKI
jgi:hypothetical protein